MYHYYLFIYSLYVTIFLQIIVIIVYLSNDCDGIISFGSRQRLNRILLARVEKSFRAVLKLYEIIMLL